MERKGGGEEAGEQTNGGEWAREPPPLPGGWRHFRASPPIARRPQPPGPTLPAKMAALLCLSCWAGDRGVLPARAPLPLFR